MSVQADRLECPGAHLAGATLRFAGSLAWDATSRLLVRSDRRSLRVSWKGWGEPVEESTSWFRTYGRGEPATVLRFSTAMVDAFEGEIRLEPGDD